MYSLIFFSSIKLFNFSFITDHLTYTFMRIKFYLVPLIAAGAIFLSSCKKNAISISFTNAKGEVPQLGNLIFRFSSSLAKDSMLNAWDSTEYIF